jgi:hypothetical protein
MERPWWPDAVVQAGRAVEAEWGRQAARWSDCGGRMPVELAARAGCACGAATHAQDVAVERTCGQDAAGGAWRDGRARK